MKKSKKPILIPNSLTSCIILEPVKLTITQMVGDLNTMTWKKLNMETMWNGTSLIQLMMKKKLNTLSPPPIPILRRNGKIYKWPTLNINGSLLDNQLTMENGNAQ